MRVSRRPASRRLTLYRVVLVALFLVACAHVPAVAPIDPGIAMTVSQRCQQAFPPQPWHATHTIFATLPFGMKGTLLGVAAAEGGALRAMLLSPEGVTLFDGTQYGNSLKVDRAVPPFDRPDFAASLMADVGNALLSPAGPPSTVGTYKSGATICRWSQAGSRGGSRAGSPTDSETTDVELGAGADVPRRIRTFRGSRLSREILLLGTPDRGFYPLLILHVPGTGGYQLEMRLVEHE
jgi:hypothetical protein